MEIPLGLPKSGPELLENMPPEAILFIDLKGIGISSWGMDLKSDRPLMDVVLLNGMDGMRSGIWVCDKFGPMLLLFISPWFTLLFSSANASQNALCVIKLSLLQKKKTFGK